MSKIETGEAFRIPTADAQREQNPHVGQLGFSALVGVGATLAILTGLAIEGQHLFGWVVENTSW